MHQNTIARYNNGMTLSNGKAEGEIKELLSVVRYTSLWNFSHGTF